MTWNILEHGWVSKGTNQWVIGLGDKCLLKERRLPNDIMKSVVEEDNKNGECKRRAR